MRFGVVY